MAVRYLRVNPVILTLALDSVLKLNDFVVPQGQVLTSITTVKVDSGVNLEMSYGQQAPKTVFQGQCFEFTGNGDCPGGMDLGLSFRTNVAVAGGVVQLELCYLGEYMGGTSTQASA
jgi:hypothetical protein